LSFGSSLVGHYKQIVRVVVMPVAVLMNQATHGLCAFTMGQSPDDKARVHETSRAPEREKAARLHPVQVHPEFGGRHELLDCDQGELAIGIWPGVQAEEVYDSGALRS
jgi:hypothetical protein